MVRACLTLLFTATFVVAPALTDPFSGFRADQLPIPQIDPPIQPAGYAFAIWGLIYGWLIVSAVFGVWKRGRDAAWDVMRAPLIVSLAVGTPWLWIANQSAIWATIGIIAMAVPAIMAMLRAPSDDGWLARAPVSIYAGWLTAASCVSLGSTAAGYGVLFDQTGWAYVGIAIALAVALPIQLRAQRAPGYGLTVIWASVGIIVANGATLISAEAAVGIALITVVLVWQWRGRAVPS